MARERKQREQTRTLTLPSGSVVTGPVALIEKIARLERVELPKSEADPNPEPKVVVSADQAPPPADIPERPNRGASLAAWAAFADAVGFEYPEGASRDDIRDAYEAANPAE